MKSSPVDTNQRRLSVWQQLKDKEGFSFRSARNEGVFSVPICNQIQGSRIIAFCNIAVYSNVTDRKEKGPLILSENVELSENGVSRGFSRQSRSEQKRSFTHFHTGDFGFTARKGWPRDNGSHNLARYTAGCVGAVLKLRMVSDASHVQRFRWLHA